MSDTINLIGVKADVPLPEPDATTWEYDKHGYSHEVKTENYTASALLAHREAYAKAKVAAERERCVNWCNESARQKQLCYLSTGKREYLDAFDVLLWAAEELKRTPTASSALASQPTPAPADTTKPALLQGEPDYTCHLFQALAAQLTPTQQGELEVIRIAVIQLRQWGWGRMRNKPAPVLLTDDELDQPFIDCDALIDRKVARAIESAVHRKNGWGV